MPSSTSNSKSGDEALPDAKPVPGPIDWALVGRTVFFVLLGMTILWEGYWRYRGFVPTHKDDVGLWTDEWERLKTAGPGAVAVIGASRIFYGLETDMIRERTGRPVIQLAVNGMSPLPSLEELAADDSFSGIVLCGVSLQTLFGQEKFAQKAEQWIRAYRRQTPTDRLNHAGHKLLEKLFVYPSKEELFLQLAMTFQILTTEPKELLDPGSTQLSIFDEKRGSYMTDFVMRSKSVRMAIVRMQIRDVGNPKAVSPEKKAAVLERVRRAVAKIHRRGGKVIFIQYQAGGIIAQLEGKVWPREEYWEPLAAIPGTLAVHYADDPQMAALKTVEDSHLSRADRKIFTAALMKILNRHGIFGETPGSQDNDG